MAPTPTSKMPAQRSDYRMLWIDLDGTLIQNSKFFFNPVINASLAWSLGRSAAGFWRSLRAFPLMHSALLATESQTLNSDRGFQAFAQATGLTLAQARKILEPSLEQAFLRASHFIKPVRGAEDFMVWARSRYSCVLATNPAWPAPCVASRLSRASLRFSDFTFVTHADNMHAIKPTVAYYQELLDICQSNYQVEASQILMIGNDLVKDTPAQQVGVNVFLLAFNAKQKALFANHSILNGDYDDLKQHLLSNSGA